MEAKKRVDDEIKHKERDEDEKLERRLREQQDKMKREFDEEVNRKKIKEEAVSIFQLKKKKSKYNIAEGKETRGVDETTD